VGRAEFQVAAKPVRRRLCISPARPLANVGAVEDVQPLSVSGHHDILNSIVHHLGEVAGAVQPTLRGTLFAYPNAAARPVVDIASVSPASSNGTSAAARIVIVAPDPDPSLLRQ
jgi:hypothetical protein